MSSSWPPRSPENVRKTAIDKDDEEEDEETLQLQIQAIEAKLKLKKLQKKRNQSPQSSSNLEIPLSPVKKPIPPTQSSPRRVQLGIDKGISGHHVSLQRTNTARQAIVAQRTPLLSRKQSREAIRKEHGLIKSFSERMASMCEPRGDEVAAGGGRYDVNQRVSKTPPQIVQITRIRKSTELYDEHSQLDLAKRSLTASSLARSLPPQNQWRIPELLKKVTSPSYELPDVDDFAVFGVIASKSDTKDQKQTDGTASNQKSGWENKWDTGLQNSKKFIAMTVTDLQWSIDVYLFGTSMPRYHRLQAGTVVAIINPSIMPPKKGKEDTGAFSLALNSSDDLILEIGQARDFAFCKAVKKDGKDCSQWVNKSKTEYCEWHINTQVAKTQSSRMGVNTGSNDIRTFSTGNTNGADRKRPYTPKSYTKSQHETDFSKKGLLPAQQGVKYDRETQSHIYITPGNSSAPSSNRGRYNNLARSGSSRAYVNGRNDDDELEPDYFLEAGNVDLADREKQSRIRKRLASKQKERDITRELSKLPGAGGEYAKQTVAKHTSATVEQKTRDRSSSSSSESSTWSILRNKNKYIKKRTLSASHIRLSPAKRLRFGEGTKVPKDMKKQESDDDLEIV